MDKNETLYSSDINKYASESQLVKFMSKDPVEEDVSIVVTKLDHAMLSDLVDFVEDYSKLDTGLNEKLNTKKLEDLPSDVLEDIKSKVNEFSKNSKAQFVKVVPVADMRKTVGWGPMTGTSLMKLLEQRSIDKDALALINPIEHAFLREAILYVAENMSPIEAAEQFTGQKFTDLPKQDQRAIAMKFKEFVEGSDLTIPEHLDKMGVLPDSNNDCFAKCATLKDVDNMLPVAVSVQEYKTQRQLQQNRTLGLGACAKD